MLLEQKKEDRQLSLFNTSLPAKPYCADDLDYGLVIRTANNAIKKRYIQHNKPTSVHWLTFDCDYPGAIEKLTDDGLPMPNLAVLNRKNGHSHLLYGLEVPVHRTTVARAKPLNFLAKVEYALREKLSADFGYSGLIVKNPNHADWLTYELNSTSFDLAELSEYLILPEKLPKKALLVGLGRNCSLFETLRRWAYANVLNFRLSGNFEGFKDAVLCQSIALNTFPQPLPLSEIRSTAKSISKWTWQNYTGRLPDEAWAEYVRTTHLPEIQAYRGRLGGLKGGRGGRASEDVKQQARELYQAGLTQQEVASQLGKHQSTIQRWLK